MAGNTNLHSAKKAKNDEFYTQKEDIEAELSHYAEHFRGKVVYCNCDDPVESEFWKFFVRVFNAWGLKKLIATHYEPNEENFSYKLEAVPDENGLVHVGDDPIITPLPCNGDFRSAACIELLKEADIVVTNPPFSLFREYVAQLMECRKKFVIIGNMNCVTYKEIFPLIRDNQMWVGINPKTGTRRGNSLLFGVPDGYQSGSIVMYNGKPCAQVSSWWFTNLDHSNRHNPLDLRGMKYTGNEDKYPHYDNYDAINVDSVEGTTKKPGIPEDYFECIGVPISFLTKHCPEQFEIVGATESEGKGFSNGLFIPVSTDQAGRQADDATHGVREEDLQTVVHSSQKIKIHLQPDGTGKIFPQVGIDLQMLANQYVKDGFVYYSGVIGVPISFLLKYCPEQFEIVAFSSTVLSHPCSTAQWGLITGAKQTICSDGKSRYARVAIRRKI